ncbi:MAG: hypothetical protein ISS87_00125 [Candidatus Pacebacteria bacterium]|nr:hypothetical protein [Candidatus Paceibacterota bacterium]
MNLSKKNLFKILIILVVLIILVILSKKEKVEIITDKIEYNNESDLKVRVQNLLTKDICLSSCYPFSLEWRTDPRASIEWSAYFYEDCSEVDVIEKCIQPGETKIFKTILPEAKQGIHRISIPICSNCIIGQEFQETKKFYSNEFEIK